MDGVSRPSATRAVGLVVLLACSITALFVFSRGRAGLDKATLTGQVSEALRARQWARAELLLDRLSVFDPSVPEHPLFRAELAKARGRTDEALAVLADVPDSHPLAARARLLAGQIERERERMRRAEGALLEALRLDRGLTQARRELIYVYGMQARRTDLDAAFRSLAEVGRLSFDDLFLWTVCKQDVWVNEAIRPDLERYLRADPEDRWSRLALAGVHLRASRADEARAVLRPLESATDPDVIALRARIALERSREEEAGALLEQGPVGHAVLARLRGELAMRRKDWPTAVTSLRRAVSLDPFSLQSAQSLALALRQTGQAGEAASFGDAAERLRRLAGLLEMARPPRGHLDRTLPARIGAACEAVGQVAEARGWYGLAIQIDPLDARSQRGLFRVRAVPDGAPPPDAARRSPAAAAAGPVPPS
jgi:tetratricopeptide (TPR) repeat protein